MDSTAGFVLTGGRSSRMGRDKALLPIDGSRLVERTAERVRAAAGNVTLIGAPGRYAHFGLPVLPDLVEGAGPIGGLHTALKTTSADWNLEVACAGTVEFTIRHKQFKMHDLLKSLGAVSWPAADASLIENVNTPLEWGAR